MPDLSCLRHAAFAAVATFLPFAAHAQTNDAAVDLSFAPLETPRPPNSVSGVRSIAVQPDGLILVGGDFDDNFFANHVTGQQQNLTRLKPDGHYDPSFKFTFVSSLIETIHVLDDKRILISGFFDSVATTARDGIARLNADGTVDASFGPAGTYTHPGSRVDLSAVAVQADGKVFVGGAYRITFSDGSTRDNLMRLTANGAADPTFVVADDDSVSVVHSLAIQADGKILAGGNDNRIFARYNPDGTLDPTFTPHIINGRNFGHPGEAVYALAIQPDGKIIAGGDFVASEPSLGRASLARFNPDGSLDATFDPQLESFAQVLSLALQPDGKIIIGGRFSTSGVSPRTGLARLNSDGSVDATFDSGAGALDEGKQPATIEAIALQADGKALIGGNLNTYDGQPRAGVARLGGGAPPPPPLSGLADLNGTVADVKAALNGTGSKFKVSGELTVSNTGVAKAKNVQVAAYLSADQTFDATTARLIGIVSLTEEGYPKVKNGKPVQLNVKFKAKPADLGPTSGHYLLIVIDPLNMIEESDETNNVAFSELLP